MASLPPVPTPPTLDKAKVVAILRVAVPVGMFVLGAAGAWANGTLGAYLPKALTDLVTSLTGP